MIIRRAEIKDMERLLEIYNYEVLYGTATFDLNPKTMEERMVWFCEHNVENHPLIVAEQDGKVVGYASLSPYRDKEAYARTVELSVYIHPDNRRQGTARKLMEEMLAMARADENIHTVISVITGGNDASIKLHDAFGFTYCGVMREVGEKFGRPLDIVNYQLFI